MFVDILISLALFTAIGLGIWKYSSFDKTMKIGASIMAGAAFVLWLVNLIGML